MNPTALSVKIRQSGLYIPSRAMLAEDVDRIAGYPPATVRSRTLVERRYWAGDAESQAYMGARAIEEALRESGCGIQDIDCIVCASGTPHRPLPCTASSIQHELGSDARGIPCFDIDSTCLSFITALNLMSAALACGQYKRVVIVSTEKTSVGLNYASVESSGLFGDGAVACIIERDPEGKSCILGSSMMTDAKYNDICRIEGGGTHLHAKMRDAQNASEYLFHMDGPLLLKRVLYSMKPFLADLYAASGITQRDIHCVIPHQASPRAMEIVRRFLGFQKQQWVSIVHEYGNCVAASIPMALHVARQRKQVTSGDTVMLLGTGAGIALAGAVIVL